MELLVSNGGNMGKYSKKGLYSAYDKNHKDALILNTIIEMSKLLSDYLLIYTDN